MTLAILSIILMVIEDMT